LSYSQSQIAKKNERMSLPISEIIVSNPGLIIRLNMVDPIKAACPEAGRLEFALPKADHLEANPKEVDQVVADLAATSRFPQD
jgi:hypothetical protein